MKPLSVVIPSWNGVSLLRRCLPSVLSAVAQYGGVAEVVVVDDGSADDSASMLAAEFPTVRVVRHPVNRGFGPACKTGIEAAEHPIVVLLNSDVRVEPGFLAPLAARFDHPAAFAVSPLILDSEGDLGNVTISVPYVRRGKIRYRSVPTGRLLEPGASQAGPWYTSFPLGGAVALDRSRFLALGGFDPLFEPFYYEDTDLGLCAWRRGWTCEVVPDSRVFHEGGGTIGRSFERSRVRTIQKRNRVLFHVKNLTAPWMLAAYLLQHTFRVFAGLFRLDFAQAGGAFEAVPHLGHALARRRVERAAELRTPAEVFATISTQWDECVARLASGDGGPAERVKSSRS